MARTSTNAPVRLSDLSVKEEDASSSAPGSAKASGRESGMAARRSRVASSGTPVDAAAFEKWYQRYSQDHDVVTIGTRFPSVAELDDRAAAAVVRAAVNRAVSSGQLPRGRYSVRTARGAFCRGAYVEYSLNLSTVKDQELKDRLMLVVGKRLSNIVSRFDRSGVSFSSLDSPSSAYSLYTIQRDYSDSAPLLLATEARAYLEQVKREEKSTAPLDGEVRRILSSGDSLARILQGLDRLGFTSMKFARKSLPLLSDERAVMKSVSSAMTWLSKRYGVSGKAAVVGGKLTLTLTPKDPFDNEGDWFNCLRSYDRLAETFVVTLEHEGGSVWRSLKGGAEVKCGERPKRKRPTDVDIAKIAASAKVGETFVLGVAEIDNRINAVELHSLRRAVAVKATRDFLYLAAAGDLSRREGDGQQIFMVDLVKVHARGPHAGKVLGSETKAKATDGTWQLVEKVTAARAKALAEARREAPVDGVEDPGDMPLLDLDVLTGPKKGDRVDVSDHSLGVSYTQGGRVVATTKDNITVLLDNGKSMDIQSEELKVGRRAGRVVVFRGDRYLTVKVRAPIR